MSLHLCYECSAPTERLLCRPCACRAFTKLKAAVEATNITLRLMDAELAALRSDLGKCPHCGADAPCGYADGDCLS